MAEELVVKITADDKASGALKGIQGALGGIGNVAMGALKVGLGAAVVGFGALAAGIGKAVGEASQAENATAQLDAALKASAVSTKSVSGVSREAMSAIASAASEHKAKMAEAAASGVEVMARINERAQDLALSHRERISDLTTNLEDLDEDYADRRGDLQDQLNNATDESDRQRILKQMNRAERQHQRAEERIKKQIDRAQKEFERETKELEEQKRKQEKINAESLKRIEADYKKALGEIESKFSAVERGIAKLPVVIQPTREMLLGLASAFQNTTKFSDDMVLSAETVLLRFKSIGQDVFPQALGLTLDLATALGTDATSAATLLGKALETPGEGLARLKAAGVAFTEAQEKQIKAMMDAGNVAGAQKLIMDELAKSVGGAAKASGETFAGQLTILQNSFSDILETVGVAFLPTLKDLVKFVNENIIPALSKWATEIAPQVQAALKGIGELATAVAQGDFAKLEEAFWKWINEVDGLVADKFTQLVNTFTTWVNSAEGQAQLGAVGEQIGNAIVEGIVKLFDQDKESIGYRIGNGLYQAVQAVPGAMADIGAGIAVGILNGILRQLTGYEFAENTRVAMRQMFSAAILDINELVSSLFNPFAMMRLGQVSSHAIGGVIPGSTSQGRLALVHGGEQIIPAGGMMRGGGNGLIVNLTYAPALSLGDEREFRDRLQPFIESAIIEARRRQI